MIADELRALAERLYMRSAGDYIEEDRITKELRALADKLQGKVEESKRADLQALLAQMTPANRVHELKSLFQHAFWLQDEHAHILAVEQMSALAECLEGKVVVRPKVVQQRDIKQWAAWLNGMGYGATKAEAIANLQAALDRGE